MEDRKPFSPGVVEAERELKQETNEYCENL